MSHRRATRLSGKIMAIALVPALAIAFAPVASSQTATDNEKPVYEGGEVVAGVPAEGSGLTSESEEVRFLADLHGVSSDEALVIANWMLSAESAVSKIRRNYVDSFAGSEFVHLNGTVRLDLWVTGDGSAELRSLESEVQPSEVGSVELRVARVSERDLAAQTEFLAQHEPAALGASSQEGVHGGLDFKSGSFVPEHPEVLATLELDSDDACTHGAGGWLEGGRRLRIATSESPLRQERRM